MDDVQRIALIETRTQGNDGSPAQLIRFQLGNHLGSAAVEIDDAVQIISYEEYFPYGSTSYQAVDAAREVPLKRYRYTGKERDEETGLSYHGARYYAPWLGRWTSCDPAGIADGLNIYRYVSNNPINLVDPTGTEDAPSPIQQWVEKNPARAEALASAGLDLNKVVPPLIAEETRAADRGKPPAQGVDPACTPVATPPSAKPVRTMQQYTTATPKDLYNVGRLITVEGRARYFRGTKAELDDAEWTATYANAVESSQGLQAAGTAIQPGSASSGIGGSTTYTPSIVESRPVINAPSSRQPAAFPEEAKFRFDTSSGKPSVVMPELKIEINTKGPNAAPQSPTFILPEAPDRKTVSGAPYSPTYRSGWGRGSEIGDYNPAVANWRYNQQQGTPFSTHGLDLRGAPGSYNASHAEAQQLYTQPGIEFLEVSRPECFSCKSRFSLSAQQWDAPIVVLSPNGFRWYTPSGSFW
jgi:RHS repeat-associated protein